MNCNTHDLSLVKETKRQYIIHTAAPTVNTVCRITQILSKYCMHLSSSRQYCTGQYGQKEQHNSIKDDLNMYIQVNMNL